MPIKTEKNDILKKTISANNSSEINVCVTTLVNLLCNPNRKFRLSQNGVYGYLGFSPLLTAKRPKQSERGQKTAEGYMKGVTAHNIQSNTDRPSSLTTAKMIKKTRKTIFHAVKHDH